MSGNMSLLWNGCKRDGFVPSRGLRQGDPLSPYLFVLGMDKLSHMIADCVRNKSWKPIRLGRNGAEVSQNHT